MGYFDHESTTHDDSMFDVPETPMYDKDGAYEAYIEGLEESTPLELLNMHLKNIHDMREIKRQAELKVCKITQHDQEIMKILKRKLSGEEEEDIEEEDDEDIDDEV